MPSAANAGYQYSSFYKMVKDAAELQISDLLVESVWAGFKAGLLKTMWGFNFDEFCACVKWLKSEAGCKAMHAEKQNKKRKSRAEEDKLECFFKMRQVYANERARVIKMAKKEIDEMRSLREKKMQADIEALDQKYLPVSTYKEPEENVVANLAYKLYAEEAEQQNEKPIDRVVGGLGEALRLKGAEARQMLLKNHTMQPRFEKQLSKIMNDN